MLTLQDFVVENGLILGECSGILKNLHGTNTSFACDGFLKKLLRVKEFLNT